MPWGGRKFEIDFKNAIGSGANSKVYTGKLDDKPVAIKVGLMSELLILPQLIKAQESGAKILFPLPPRISDGRHRGHALNGHFAEAIERKWWQHRYRP